MTPMQRAWKAMDEAGYLTSPAIDALTRETAALSDAEHRVLDRAGWGA